MIGDRMALAALIEKGSWAIMELGHCVSAARGNRCRHLDSRFPPDSGYGDDATFRAFDGGSARAHLSAIQPFG